MVERGHFGIKEERRDDSTAAQSSSFSERDFAIRSATSLLFRSEQEVVVSMDANLRQARFGLHNLRHSLSTSLVNKGKVNPKTVQGMLRHSDIRTTMNLYTKDDRDEKQAAQGAFLSAVGLGSRLVQ